LLHLGVEWALNSFPEQAILERLMHWIPNAFFYEADDTGMSPLVTAVKRFSRDPRTLTLLLKSEHPDMIGPRSDHVVDFLVPAEERENYINNLSEEGKLKTDTDKHIVQKIVERVRTIL
jgi:hypothetical protein